MYDLEFPAIYKSGSKLVWQQQGLMQAERRAFGNVRSLLFLKNNLIQRNELENWMLGSGYIAYKLILRSA